MNMNFKEDLLINGFKTFFFLNFMLQFFFIAQVTKFYKGFGPQKLFFYY